MPGHVLRYHGVAVSAGDDEGRGDELVAAVVLDRLVLGHPAPGTQHLQFHHPGAFRPREIIAHPDPWNRTRALISVQAAHLYMLGLSVW